MKMNDKQSKDQVCRSAAVCICKGLMAAMFSDEHRRPTAELSQLDTVSISTKMIALSSAALLRAVRLLAWCK